MPKILALTQGSGEWKMARLGIPTASQFDRIVSPKTGKLLAGRAAYMAELLAERAMGCPLDDLAAMSPWVQRGEEMEPEAVKSYEFEAGVSSVAVGFILTDDEAAGCSPDRLVGTDGGAELKCPAAKTHTGYILNPSDLAAEYHGQVQGCLWVTGRKWWDLMSYNPFLPPVRLRILPDAEYQAALGAGLATFAAEMAEGWKKMLAAGCQDGRAMAQGKEAS